MLLARFELWARIEVGRWAAPETAMRRRHCELDMFARETAVCLWGCLWVFEARRRAESKRVLEDSERRWMDGLW
jgi:hypothetical protein